MVFASCKMFFHYALGGQCRLFLINLNQIKRLLNEDKTAKSRYYNLNQI